MPSSRMIVPGTAAASLVGIALQTASCVCGGGEGGEGCMCEVG